MSEHMPDTADSKPTPKPLGGVALAGLKSLHWHSTTHSGKVIARLLATIMEIKAQRDELLEACKAARIFIGCARETVQRGERWVPAKVTPVENMLEIVIARAEGKEAQG